MPGWSRSRRRNGIAILNRKRGGNAAFFLSVAPVSFASHPLTIRIGVDPGAMACFHHDASAENRAGRGRHSSAPKYKT
jgi:hypothetical protein